MTIDLQDGTAPLSRDHTKWVFYGARCWFICVIRFDITEAPAAAPERDTPPRCDYGNITDHRSGHSSSCNPCKKCPSGSYRFYIQASGLRSTAVRLGKINTPSLLSPFFRTSVTAEACRRALINSFTLFISQQLCELLKGPCYRNPMKMLFSFKVIALFLYRQSHYSILVPIV